MIRYLPCPLCGQSPMSSEQPNHVHCDNSICPMFRLHIYEYKWNNRHVPQPVVQMSMDAAEDIVKATHDENWGPDDIAAIIQFHYLKNR